MQPINPNLSFPCLPTDDRTGQDLIDYHIDNAGQKELRELLDREHLTKNQLQRARNRDGINWSQQELAWINQRIQTIQQSQIDREIVVPDINAINTPPPSYTGAEGGARSVSPVTEAVRELTLTSSETNQPQNNSARGNAAHRPQPATQLPEGALVIIRANSNKTDDQIEQEIHSNNPPINNLLDLQPMTREQLCDIKAMSDQLGMIDKRKQTLKTRIDRLQGGERETSTPALRRLYHKNPNRFIENIQYLYRTDPAQRAPTLKHLIKFGTPPTRTQPSHRSEERRESDLQRALDASSRDYERRSESSFSAPPGWIAKSRKQLDLNPEPEKTPEELSEENKKLKGQLLCQACPDDNRKKATQLYIHQREGHIGEGHRIHCEQHTLQAGDTCPKANCGEKISGVIKTYLV